MLISDLISLPQGSVSCLKNQHKNAQTDILAIHGWLDNAASFSPLIEQLPTYNWTAIDLPGHGHSFHRPNHAHYHFIDWVSDIVDLIRTNYEKPVTIVAHSLGGMLSTVIAGVYPELVERLVLIDAAGLITQTDEDGAAALRKALDSRTEQGKKSRNTNLSFNTAVKARMMAGKLSKPAAELLMSRNLSETSEGYIWCSDNRLRTRSPIRMQTSQARSIINAITAPVMILLANDGHDEIHQSFHQYQDCYQNLISMQISGGHHCHMENSAQCAQLIAKFLK